MSWGSTDTADANSRKGCACKPFEWSGHKSKQAREIFSKKNEYDLPTNTQQLRCSHIDILAEMREYILWYNAMYFCKDVHWQVRFVPALQSKKEYWNPGVYVHTCVYTHVTTCNNNNSYASFHPGNFPRPHNNLTVTSQKDAGSSTHRTKPTWKSKSWRCWVTLDSVSSDVLAAFRPCDVWKIPREKDAWVTVFHSVLNSYSMLNNVWSLPWEIREYH